MSAAKAKSERDDKPDLLAMAFDIIAETGWIGFSFADLAEQAGLSMTDVRRQFRGRADLLDQLSSRLDQAMLAFDPKDMEGLPPKDRVFELIMSRLEAMAPYRAGLLRLMRDARTDPALLAMTACRLDRSIAWLQDAAGLADGRNTSLLKHIKLKVQRRVLGVIYVQALNSWASDDSTDLAKTMAALDKQLRRLEGLAGLGQDDAKAAPA
jgi:AcrR family transcriptional regulator